MAGESGSTGTRERTWVMKFDHATDPPTPVEEVFIENGVVVSTRAVGPESCARCGEAEIAIEVATSDPPLRYCARCAPAALAEVIAP